MTGNVFRGYQQNALFVLTSVATGQSIHLLGMLTEALHTPFLHDRWLAIDQAKTIRRTRATSATSSRFTPDGRIVPAPGRSSPARRRSSHDVARHGPLRRWPAGVFARHPAAPGRRARIRRRVRRDAGLREPVHGGLDAGPAGGPRVSRRGWLRPGPRLRRQEGRRRRAALLHAPHRRVGRRRPRPPSATSPGMGLSRAVRHARRGDRSRSSRTSSSTGAPLRRRSRQSAARRLPPRPSREAIDADIARRFGARLVVLGCALESDAHTVGLDAIFNLKGFAGDHGLERYHGFDAGDLGAQVPSRRSSLARESNADTLLVSATVTQNKDPRPPSDRLRRHARGRAAPRPGRTRRRRRAGRSASARGLGYDGGFGPGTTASRVAAFSSRRSGGVRDVFGRLSAAPRRRASSAHYGGALVDGAFVLKLFGDAATELLIRHDGDEGFFRAYSSVEFLSRSRRATTSRSSGSRGQTSREMRFEARKVIAPGALGLRVVRAARRSTPRRRSRGPAGVVPARPPARTP